MTIQQHANNFQVSVAGTKLSDQLEAELISVFVDDSLHVPDMFQLTFRDQRRAIVADAGLLIGAKVAIKVFNNEFTAGVKLIEGEITSLEAEYDPQGSFVTVRGLDMSHRLFRGRRTKAFKNASYSDVVRKVLGDAGVPVGKIDSSSPVFPLVSQTAANDWQFLQGLARELGFQIGCVDGKFNFTKAPAASTGPKPGSSSSDDPLQLVMGQNLLRVRTSVSAAEQVTEVQVRGWDSKNKQAVVGVAPAKTGSAAIGVTPAQLAGFFGSPKFAFTNAPFASQGEAQSVAEAMADQLASAFVEMEGLAHGNPKLRAGTAVSLGLAGAPFDGKYVLTNTRHSYTPDDGYTVRFNVSGAQERSLLSLVNGNGGGSGGGGGGGPNNRVFGVVVGVVTKNDDPEKLGRVQVQFPWLDADYESDWARVAQMGAGPGRGMVILPEINDEVLVAFEHGDTRRPYVLGGLYNGKDKPELGNAGDLFSSGKVNRRGFISSQGHKIVFLDASGKKGVLVATKGNKYRLSLNETKATIRIVSDGKLEIEAKQDVMITTKAKVTIDATQDITASTVAKMDFKAKGGITIDGSPGLVEVKGSIIKLN